MRTIPLSLLILWAAVIELVAAPLASERPNILWIVAEDISPFFGCYGSADAITPNIDGLAKRSHVFKRAYATAPICSHEMSVLSRILALRDQTMHGNRKAMTAFVSEPTHQTSLLDAHREPVQIDRGSFPHDDKAILSLFQVNFEGGILPGIYVYLGEGARAHEGAIDEPTLMG